MCTFDQIAMLHYQTSDRNSCPGYQSLVCRVGSHLQMICDPPRSPGPLYERIRNTLNLFNGIWDAREKRIVAIID
jgi:hypothetical protein